MLEISSLRKTFNAGTAHQVKAISGLNLSLAAGEFATIIGSNGAGKSTLLNLIAGAYQPDGGRISIAGRDVTNAPEHVRAARVGRVFQDPLLGTAGAMTVEQNLALAMRRGQRRGLGWGIDRQMRAQFHARLAGLGLGLEQRLGTRVSLLSGGQRQALTILMATLARPDLLLLDEHTAALDPLAAPRIATLTEQIVAQQGLTTLMVTHNMAMALAMGSRTLMMHQGQIILDLSGAERAQTSATELVARFASRNQELLSDRMLFG
jgi:putative ABC transport system ATP-binding protein